MNSSPIVPAGCLIFEDERFQRHRTGRHVETPQRLAEIRRRLANLEDGNRPSPPARIVSGSLQFSAAPETWEATADELRAILAVHPAEYLHRLEQFAIHGGGNWDADTVVSGDSYNVALLAARTALQGTDAVLRGRARTAVCLVRPPGHHALRDSAMGFCLLNNVAIAARHSILGHGLRRVLIVDWDVHHGNGTQEIFYEEGQVWYYSVHRSPFYPGTGAREETGAGRGLGATRNLPLPAETSRVDYLRQVTADLTEFADCCRPDLVLISAGFDAHRLDPIGSLGLETDDFRTLTQLVMQIAQTHCQGRIVSLLEGGYHLQALAESVAVHVRELAEPTPVE